MLKVKRVIKDAKVPVRANPTDGGIDLFSPIMAVVLPKTSMFIDLGIQVEIPEGFGGFIIARSGLGGKGIRPRNCIGLVDSKYRGNVGVMVENSSDTYFLIGKGDRIAQMVIMPVGLDEVIEVDELDMEDNRGGGFGSTGK